jgi:hypothetical protein
MDLIFTNVSRGRLLLQLCFRKSHPVLSCLSWRAFSGDGIVVSVDTLEVLGQSGADGVDTAGFATCSCARNSSRRFRMSFPEQPSRLLQCSQSGPEIRRNDSALHSRLFNCINLSHPQPFERKYHSELRIADLFTCVLSW